MAEKENIQAKRDGGRLLDRCIRKIQELQIGKTGGNLALYPVLIVFLGKNSADNAVYVKSVLDDNWNNARYLSYVKIEREEDSWVAKTLFRTDEQKPYEGEPQQVLNHCIEEMLEAEEGIFQRREFIKLEFILESSEEYGAGLYDLYMKLDAGRNNAEIKSLYLMLNERSEWIERSDALLRHIHKKKENAKDSIRVCVVSNNLSSNRFLPEVEMWKNYRLVADIILLSSNYGDSDADTESIGNRRSILDNGFSTVSYVLIEKPFRSIAAVSLKALLRKMYEQEEEIFQDDLTNQQIAERLGIDKNGWINDANGLYDEEIKKKLPPKEDLPYLPFSDKKTLEKILRQKDVSEKELNRATNGTWNLYKERKIKQVAEEYLGRQDRREDADLNMRRLVCDRFACIELLKMSGNEEEIKEKLQSRATDIGVGKAENGIYRLYKKADNEGRMHYHNTLKQFLADNMEQQIKCATAFDKRYKKIEDEVERESSICGKIEKSISTVYTGIVDRFVKEHRKINEKKSAFPELFDQNKDEKAIIDEIWSVYQKLTEEPEYGLDFEKEQEIRREQMTAEEREQYSRSTIEAGLLDSIRLGMKLCNSVSVSQYGQRIYLIKREADYVKQLEGNDYILFDNNRTDCIEELQVYKISDDSLSRLRLSISEAENEG